MRFKNNPLNIRAGKNAWLGQESVINGFCEFSDVPFCIRAWLYLWYISYPKVLKEDFSLSTFIHRYCPAGDGNNNPDYYLRFVCDEARVSSSRKSFSLLELYRICCAQCKMETSFPLSHFDFLYGLSLFNLKFNIPCL